MTDCKGSWDNGHLVVSEDGLVIYVQKCSGCTHMLTFSRPTVLIPQYSHEYVNHVADDAIVEHYHKMIREDLALEIQEAINQ